MDSGGAVARKGAAGTEPSNALAILAVTDLSGTSNELSPAVDTLSQPPPPPAETNKEGAGKEWPLVSTPSIAGEFGWNVAPHRRPWVPIVPFQFIPTQQDLNTPPENWLRGLHRVLEQGPAKWTSLMLADMVADKVDWSDAGIDIVSHTKTLKQLLMAPLTGSALSMVVHRVDDTLLIDDFQPDGKGDPAATAAAAAAAAAATAARANVSGVQQQPPHRQSGAGPTPAMLKKSQQELQIAFNKMVVDQANKVEPAMGGGPKPQCLAATEHRRRKDPEAQRRSKLLSKFLARSIHPAAETAAASTGDGGVASGGGVGGTTLEGLGSEHQHAWSFKDLRCLLSSDLQIFGDEAHPAVTLKLSNSNDPIQVLTGMDMWLDNLMCNVPEVVMCYHLNGVLTQYDLLKTEEIPSASGFEPAVVHDIAQNVCSFLRANCAKQGHTYWLYKEENADVVRLYDLTALCGTTGDGAVGGPMGSNPFAYPVAVLLFRIAARMYRAMETGVGDTDPATIESLLKNVLELVDGTQYPELAAATTFLLVGLHTRVSTDVVGASPSRKQKQRSPSAPTRAKSRDRQKAAAAEATPREVSPLRRLEQLGNGIAWAHTGAQATKSHAALLGAILDLAYTNYILLAEDLMSKRDAPRAIACAHMALMCHAGAVAIQPKKPTKTAGSAATGTPDQQSEQQGDDHGTILPFTPVSALEDFVQPTSSKDTALARVLEVVGDVYSRMTAFFPDGVATAKHDAESRKVDPLDRPFLQALHWLVEVGPAGEGIAPLPTFRAPHFSGVWRSHGLPESFVLSPPDAVQTAVRSYRQASGMPGVDRDVQTRLHKKEGNALNVSGIGVTNSIIQIVVASQNERAPDAVATIAGLADQGHGVLTEAVTAFERAGDRLNEALVDCNLAKLMRAHAAGAATFLDPPEGPRQQQELLDLAIHYYSKAQSALQERREHPDVWDAVSVDIAGTNVACARVAADHPCAERDSAVTYYERALRAYESHRDTVEASVESRQNAAVRAADVNRDLGAIYAREARDRTSEAERAKYRCAAEMHFQKAIALYGREVASPTAALGRVETRLEFASFQVARDSAVAVTTLAAVGTELPQVFTELQSDATTVAALERIQAGIGKVVLAAIKSQTPGTSERLKGVYKQLLAEMQTTLLSNCSSGDLRKKVARIAALLCV